MLSQNSMERFFFNFEWPKFASFVFFFIVLLRFTSPCLLVPEPRPVERDSPNMLLLLRWSAARLCVAGLSTGTCLLVLALLLWLSMLEWF